MTSQLTRPLAFTSAWMFLIDARTGETMLWYDSKAIASREQAAAWDARDGLDPTLLNAAKRLHVGFDGQVVLPGDPDYDADRMLANPRFDPYPAMIVYCASESDVVQALALAFACRDELEFVLRSGGHSTGGFSAGPGILVDVGRLDGVTVDPAKLTATAQPGCNFGTFNKAIEQYDLHIPGGACPDVRQGGYFQGGGYGFTARLFGMHCDQAIGVRMALFDGTIVEADETVNSDLFWAVRGGTGNNFGVLLSTTYRLFQGSTFCGFSVKFDLSATTGVSDAANALTWIQENFVLSVTNALGFQMIMVWEGPDGQPRTPLFLVRGVYAGTRADMLATIGPLVAQQGAELQYTLDPTVYSKLSGHLLSEPYEVPQFGPNVTPMPPPENKVSRYIADVIPPAGWTTLIDHFLASPNPYTTVAFEGYGGTINATPALHNAFVHRDVHFDIFFDVFWLTDAEEAVMDAYLEQWKATIAPFWNGQVYQNYPEQVDPDFADHYWGAALPGLVKVKQKYDPGNLFHFAQSIPTSLTTTPEDAFRPPGIDEPIVHLVGPSRQRTVPAVP